MAQVDVRGGKSIIHESCLDSNTSTVTESKSSYFAYRGGGYSKLSNNYFELLVIRRCVYYLSPCYNFVLYLGVKGSGQCLEISHTPRSDWMYSPFILNSLVMFRKTLEKI